MILLSRPITFLAELILLKMQVVGKEIKGKKHSFVRDFFKKTSLQ